MRLLGDFFGFARTSPLELAQEIVRATNARDFPALERVLSRKFTFVDGDGNRVEGSAAFLDAARQLIAATPDFRLSIDRFDVTDESVVMHGETLSADPDFASEALWRVVTRRGKVHLIENYIASARARLVDYVANRPSAN